MARRLSHAAPRKESAQTRVAEALRTAIFTGELRPGDPVTELHLSDIHQVSQTTVREALVRLEHAGLVRRIHNVGTFVTQLSPREMQERIRLRVMLEGLAGMEAARMISSRQVKGIHDKLDALSTAVRGNDHFGAAQADLEFHQLVWSYSGDRTLCQVLEQITVPLFAFVSMERRRMQETLTEELIREHEPIAQALADRDPLAAQEAMRKHLETAYAGFMGSAQPYILAAS